MRRSELVRHTATQFIFSSERRHRHGYHPMATIIAAITNATTTNNKMRLIKRNLLSSLGSLLELPHPVSAARLPLYYTGPIGFASPSHDGFALLAAALPE